MAASTTSKQPMLVDRPLFEFAILGPVAALTAPANAASLSPGGLVVLVPESADGALIDSISVIANRAAITAARVHIFMSTERNALSVNTGNTVPIAVVTIASGSVGARSDVPLLPLLAPVHNVSRAGTGLITEQEKKTTGLMLPKGRTLYAGLSERLQAPTVDTTVTVVAQGGYY